MRIPQLVSRLLLVAALLALPSALAGQVGATTDILTGTVRDSTGQPVAEAIVEAFSIETEISRTTKTDTRGRWVIVFPDGGGQYRLVIRSIGMTPVERLVTRQADEDRLVLNVTMNRPAQRLADVVVSERRGPVIAPNAPTPGSIERMVTPDQAARLPLDPSDLLALALLAPGVVQIESTDSSAAAFSVAGQRPDANSITLDGMTFGATSVPPDALRTTRVITNTYDAARGQFSGGQIASVTRGGTNQRGGSANYGLRDRNLEVDGGEDDAFARGYTQHQLSGGFGGPLVRNRLFAFGSFQGRLRSDDLQSLLSAPAASLSQLGAHPDSVSRFLGLLSGYGVPVTMAETDSRATDNWSSLVRLDWLVSGSHTLTVRGDWRGSTNDPSRIGSLALPQTGGRQTSSGGGGMATLTSRLGSRVINEFKGYASGNSSASNPFLLAPQGRVQVASELDGNLAVSSLTFGGNPGLPSTRSGSTLEFSDEVSWLPGAAAHRFKLGALYNRTRTSQNATSNRYGTFSYNSLADLEAGRPAMFTRTLEPVEREGTASNAAVYLADVWRAGDAWQLTWGLRLEHSGSGGAPAYNPEIDQLFGYRTDALPSETHVSPRFGFTWMIGAGERSGPPGWTVRGGIGEFRSPFNTGLLAAAQGGTGLLSLESQLVCVGAAAPVPDWEAYLADPSSIPTSCLTAGPTPTPTRSPTVTLFDPDYAAPRSWRGSVGVQRRLGLVGLSVDLSYARGVAQAGYTDVNLVETPAFRLAAERNRPVFAPAASIDPGTGATSLLASRRHGEFGQVLAIGSDLGSETAQLTLAGNGFIRGGIVFNASYTHSRSRDQGSGGGFAAPTTAGDPNVREWSTSDFERRHAIQTSATIPVGGALEITTIARMTSGVPYTPRVGGDINGDGSRNDRAFIYEPGAAPDTAIANGMSRLLEGASGGARACLEAQLGRIAGRNSCRGPWTPSLELQFNWRPNGWGLNRKLMLSLTTVNLLAGIDRLVHEDDDLAGWGQPIRPDATLLYVQGFDPAAQRFGYAVNERFGSARSTANAIRTPFQIGLQARWTIGRDRQREVLDAVRRGGGLPGGIRFGAPGGPGGAGGGAQPGGGANFLSRFETLIPNPAKQVLELRLGLRLTDAQVRQLTALADSTTAGNTRLADSARAMIEKAGANPDPARLFDSLRPMLTQGQAKAQDALKAVQSVLTAEQWAQVPERIRAPGPRFGGPGQRPAGGRPPGS